MSAAPTLSARYAVKIPEKKSSMPVEAGFAIHANIKQATSFLRCDKGTCLNALTLTSSTRIRQIRQIRLQTASGPCVVSFHSTLALNLTKNI